jgi:tetratricopeptide (TPR) repeat protein
MAADFIQDDRELEALFRKYETAPDSYVFAPLADAYRKAGMLEEALELCKKGLRRHPDYPSGHVVRGKCHFDLGQIEEAERSFQTVIDLDENNLVALKYLGMIQAGRGELRGAKERFKHILALDPDNREITSMLAELQEAERSKASASDTADGVEEFEGEPISLGYDDDDTSDELATRTLAEIYLAQGYTDKAVKIYREILRNQPHNEEIKRKLVELEGAGQFSEIDRAAVLEFEEMPAVDGDSDGAETSSAGSGADAERGRRAAAAEKPAKPAKTQAEETAADAGPKPLDDQKSYEQFKRWLKNLQR